MAARIIAVAQQKGGAGKTTIAAHLAVAWAGGGRRVGLIDIDPQQSLSMWHGLRQARRDGGAEVAFETAESWKLRSALDRLGRHCEVVIVDCPPRIESDARAAVRAADLTVMPVQASPMDLWATRPTVEIAARERTPVLLVPNRVPPRGRLSDAVLRELKLEKLPLSRTQLGNRVAYAASLMEGGGVTETTPRSRAAGEIRALGRELQRKLKALG